MRRATPHGSQAPRSSPSAAPLAIAPNGRGPLLASRLTPAKDCMKSRRGLLKSPRAIAVYLFYRSGEPLVALAAGRDLPIEAETLEGLLSVVGNFVETSVRGSRGYATTAMRYDEVGIVAVRGEVVIGAALNDGTAPDSLKADLLRIVRDFEERHWRNLASWEAATKLPDQASDEFSKLLRTTDRR